MIIHWLLPALAVSCRLKIGRLKIGRLKINRPLPLRSNCDCAYGMVRPIGVVVGQVINLVFTHISGGWLPRQILEFQPTAPECLPTGIAVMLACQKTAHACDGAPELAQAQVLGRQV